MRRPPRVRRLPGAVRGSWSPASSVSWQGHVVPLPGPQRRWVLRLLLRGHGLVVDGDRRQVRGYSGQTDRAALELEVGPVVVPAQRCLDGVVVDVERHSRLGGVAVAVPVDGPAGVVDRDVGSRGGAPVAGTVASPLASRPPPRPLLL